MLFITHVYHIVTRPNRGIRFNGAEFVLVCNLFNCCALFSSNSYRVVLIDTNDIGERIGQSDERDESSSERWGSESGLIQKSSAYSALL
jgi:hypothetical protein